MKQGFINCQFCGREISSESTFCPYCGQKVVSLQVIEQEEAARRQREAEEAARKQREAEEAARKQREAEEAARRQREAEEAARKQREAEEAARKQREAEEAARRQREAEEAARRQREAEDAARKQREAEESARRQREAEEAARRQTQASQQEQQFGQQTPPPEGPNPPFSFESTNGELSVMGILTEGIPLGLAKFGTIFGAAILWLLTIWIPYLNVGTTIAIKTMPIALASDEELGGATYIFNGQYRKYMGEYFTLIGLMGISLWPAYMFFIVPGIIIALGWSQALYLVFDKHITPSDALLQSNERTFGHKMTLFLTGAAFNVGFFLVAALLVWLVGLIDVSFITFVIVLLLIALYLVGSVGCHAVIYKKLCR